MNEAWFSRSRHLAVLCWMALALHTPSVWAAKPLPYILMTPAELRDIGIALDTSRINAEERERLVGGTGQPFPNRCFNGGVTISVSNALLEDFRTQGFSLTSLCIGLESSHVTFHPESGKPLNGVMVRYLKEETPGEPGGTVNLLIEIPKCFAKGTPYLDCKMKYDWIGGTQLSKEDSKSYSEKGQEMQRFVQQMLSKGRFKTLCGCNDLRVEKYDESTSMFEIKPSARCRVDKTPICPGKKTSFDTPETLFFDFNASQTEYERTMKIMGLANLPDWGMLNESLEISPDLPYGYAHNVSKPEGDPARNRADKMLKKPRVTSN